MSISPYYNDESVINSLRSFFDLDEQWTIDFESSLAHLEDYDDDYFKLLIKDRSFLIHRVHGGVVEVTA